MTGIFAIHVDGKEYNQLVNQMARPGIYTKPMSIDEEIVMRTFEGVNKQEQQRRRRSVDDSFRDKILDKSAPTGQFRFAEISMHDPWEKTYMDKYGKWVPMDSAWKCPRCGQVYLTGYPPEGCFICHAVTPFGQMVKDGVFRR